MEFILDALLVALGWTHVLVAPYAKVEESFNLHALHDMLMYGVTPKALPYYDHFVFPGAVPRTFIGSVVLAWITNPILKLAAVFGLVHDKIDLQILIRLVLASVNALGLCLVRRAASERFGRSTGLFFALLTCSQFQLPFWMGRTVPNMFALFLVNTSTYFLLCVMPSQKRRQAGYRSLAITISLLVFAAAVFRAEVALLLGPLALQLLFMGWISFYQLLAVGLLSSIFSTGLTILVDSYFWRQPYLWPEFSSIYFNVVQGKSAEWGTSPLSTYFAVFLPKLLLSALPLSVLGMLTDARVRKLVAPSLVFITLISLLGHKEWRFIVYVVPIFNIAAARACSAITSLRQGGLRGSILTAMVCGCILTNLAYTSMATWSSSENYPGGEAMQRLHTLYPASKPLHVHIANLACQTGASLFLHENSPPYHESMAYSLSSAWTYNKTEGLRLDQLISPTSPFTHLIVEELPVELPLQWKVVDVVQTFNGLRGYLDINATIRAFLKLDYVALAGQLRRLSKLPMRDALWVLERT